MRGCVFLVWQLFCIAVYKYRKEKNIHNIHRVINNFVEKCRWIFFIVIHYIVNNLLTTLDFVSINTILIPFFACLLDIVVKFNFYPQDVGTIIFEK